MDRDFYSTFIRQLRDLEFRVQRMLDESERQTQENKAAIDRSRRLIASARDQSKL